MTTRERPELGVNRPWFFGSYGHDAASNEHHPTWGHRFDTGHPALPSRIWCRDLSWQ